MSVRPIYTVWCDHPDGGCRAWVAQTPVQGDAIREALGEGWHQPRDERGRFIGQHHCPDHGCEEACARPGRRRG